MRSFEYFATRIINASLDIDDIGNCAIKACNDKGAEYYMLIETRLGQTRMFIYGPATPEFDLLPASVNISFNRMEFNEKRLSKGIRSFLNNPYYQITQAFEITKEELLENCKDLISYMEQETYW